MVLGLGRLTHGRGRYGGAAAERLEAGVDDLAGVLVDADLQLHDVAAGRRADQPGADVGIILVERPHVPRVVVVVHHPLVVRPRPRRGRARLAGGAKAEPPEPRGEEPPASRAQHRPRSWSCLRILLVFPVSELEESFSILRVRSGLWWLWFLFVVRCGGEEAAGIRCGKAGVGCA